MGFVLGAADGALAGDLHAGVLRGGGQGRSSPPPRQYWRALAKVCGRPARAGNLPPKVCGRPARAGEPRPKVCGGSCATGRRPGQIRDATAATGRQPRKAIHRHGWDTGHSHRHWMSRLPPPKQARNRRAARGAGARAVIWGWERPAAAASIALQGHREAHHH